MEWLKRLIGLRGKGGTAPLREVDPPVMKTPDAPPKQEEVAKLAQTVIPALDDIPSPPIATSFQQTGLLEHSSTFSGVVARYHKTKWLYTGDQFFRNFEDSPRKWDQEERYAGKGINCGHFFGCTVRASDAEANSYKMNRADHSLLEVDLALDSVLDLTYEENIDWVFSRIFKNPEVLGNSYFNKLIELINHQKGGDQVNQFVGIVAVYEEFDGILFYGARAMRRYASAWTMNPEDPLIYLTEQIAFPQMRADKDLQNLVVLSGSLVIRKTKRYRIEGGEWQENPYYGVTQNELDKVLDYPSHSQPDPRWSISKKIEFNTSASRTGRAHFLDE